MDPLALSEQQKYELLWSSHPDYRKVSPADHLTPLFLQCFQEQIQKGDMVIDCGCGVGRSANHLLSANLHVLLVDFCSNCLDLDIFLKTVGPKPQCQFLQACLWDLPSHLHQAEWAICFDVLEHIPEEKIDATLHGIAQHMKKGGLLSIALMEDGFGKAIGETLHLTLKSTTWWKEKIQHHFTIHQEFPTPDNYLVLAIEKL